MVTMEAGVVTADGNGNAARTVDQSGTASLPQSQSLNLTYSFSANGVGNVGSGTTAILISGNKLVFISNTSKNPLGDKGAAICSNGVSSDCVEIAHRTAGVA
jgi:hypothetical protein